MAETMNKRPNEIINSATKRLKPNVTQTITAEEVKLYDRQIRLWGMEAQQRMRNAKILTLGQNSLMNELLKNIVLAGISHITLLSPKIVSEQDLGGQFLLTKQDIGKPNTIVKERLQKLNPRVDLKSVNLNINQLTEEFIKDFHIVCMVDQTPFVISKINSICRKFNIAFWAGENMGKHTTRIIFTAIFIALCSIVEI